MTARISHLLRALSVTFGALLLVLVPLCGSAQEEPSTLIPQNAAPTPAPSTSTPAGVPSSTIHPGDQLAISVYDVPNLSRTVTVQADGAIQYPLVGAVPVAGLTPDKARDVLAHRLTAYVKRPQVTLTIQQSGQMNVLVLGNVKGPGKYMLQGGARLTDAIAAGGGVATMNGEYPTVRVSRPDGTFATQSLQDLLVKGDAAQNVVLSNDAIVYVTGAETIRVQVLGAVTRPGNVEVHQGDRLSMALARAGAEAQAKPDLNRVYLTRKDPATGKSVSYQVDLYAALQRGDSRFDPILMKNDTVYVPEARQISPATIGVLGILGRVLGL